ncbi:MAG: hypothetical protein NTW03_05260 [Verrucomicrobia bacterium]|nr:hypothetical protein [Verrucomicrobiota bacterium]
MTSIHTIVIVTALALLAYRLIGSRFNDMYLPPVLRYFLYDRPICVRDSVMVGLSLALVACSLCVILSGYYDQAALKWVFGVIGLIAGFWLRPGKEPKRSRKTNRPTGPTPSSCGTNRLCDDQLGHPRN